MLVTVFCHSTVFAEVLKDPTRPPSHRSSGYGQAGTKAAPRWTLSSTLIAPARRLATINGKTVGVGQNIAGAKVIAIEPTRVALLNGNKRIILKLTPVDIKKAR
ncbi:MAG: hypothetical protein PVG75_14170 [Thioalkalispiraceae bacterium]|jgi:hypothetical protein